MKKSTKIILIASGAVILISVVLVVVLALTMNASNNVLVPLPTPGHQPYTCQANAGIRSSGVKLKLDLSKEKLQNGKWKITLSWQYSGNTVRIESLYKHNYEGSNLAYMAYLSPIRILKNSQLIKTISVTPSSPFQNGTYTETITPKQGDKLTYRIAQDICWNKIFVGSNQENTNSKHLLNSNNQQINFNDINNPTQGPTGPAIEPTPDTEGGVCDCKKGVLPTLEYITCELRCGIYKFVVWSVQSAFKAMTYYAGIDWNPLEIPQQPAN